jgi:hypothetical protein
MPTPSHLQPIVGFDKCLLSCKYASLEDKEGPYWRKKETRLKIEVDTV